MVAWCLVRLISLKSWRRDCRFQISGCLVDVSLLVMVSFDEVCIGSLKRGPHINRLATMFFFTSKPLSKERLMMTKRLTRRESLKLSATFDAGLGFVSPENECMKPESSMC